MEVTAFVLGQYVPILHTMYPLILLSDELIINILSSITCLNYRQLCRTIE